MLTFLLRKKISIGYKSILKSCFKILLTGSITYAIGFYLSNLYSEYFEWNFLTGAIKVILISIVLIVVYFGVSHIFKIEYTEELIQKIKNKLGKKNEIQ